MISPGSNTDDSAAVPPRPARRRRVRIAFVLLTVVLVSVVIELLVRLAFAYEYRVKSLLGIPIVALDVYEVADKRRPWHWALRPGFSQTLEDAIQAKEKTGKILGAEYLAKRAKELSVAKDEVIYRINEDGFIGPEIDASHSRPRILTLGDSCTFGSLFNRYSYPRAMERELRRLGREAEVVNAGVEGYGPRQVLARIRQFKALEPEIVTIQIGWNALFDQSEFNVGMKRYVRTIGAVERLTKFVRKKVRPRETDPLALYKREKRPDPHARIIERLSRYQPSFAGDVRRIARKMQSSNGRVVIMTLPGLYVLDEQPSARALEIGYLPPYTRNPFVLAKMADRCNDWLRSMAAREGLDLVDLSLWSRSALQPREEHFIDSVHLTEEAQEMMGKFIARRLLPLLSD